MKIRFTRDYTVRDAQGTTYKEGETLECNAESAQHFIKRGAAEFVPLDEPRKKRAGAAK